MVATSPKTSARIFRQVLQTRRSGRLWLVASSMLTLLAVLIPNSTYPLLTLVSLLGATAAGYLALMRRTVLWLALIALIAAVAVWAGPGELTNNGIQWLAAALVLIIAIAAVIYYVRGLEERLFEASWQAEISSEAADLGVFRWEFASNRLHASPKLRELLSLPTEGAVYADDVFRKVHDEDLEHMRRDIEDAHSNSAAFRSEFRVRDGRGRFRWICGRGRVIVDPRSGALSLAGVNYDITDLKERESLVSKLIDGIGAVFSIMTPDGEILDLNEYGEAVSGKTEEEWKGQEFWELQMWGRSEDTRATVQRLIERAGDEGQVTGEAPFWDEEGHKGWALITVTPILSDFGDPIHLCLCAVDISKRKAAEENNDLLVHELNHRIKNLFSVTNALISLSARYAATVDDFAEATRRRLFALHEAHNIGADDLKKRSADLREILEVTLRPWRMKPQRIFINGESKIFDAGAATAWALIAHELASNAAKYGCLREAGGRLTIDWRENDEEFVFEWREENSTPILEPDDQESSGFGKNIIYRLVDGFLSGEIERDMTDEGTSVSIRMPKAA